MKNKTVKQKNLKSEKLTNKQVTEGGKEKLKVLPFEGLTKIKAEKLTPREEDRATEFRTELIYSPEDKKLQFGLKFNKYFRKMNESIVQLEEENKQNKDFSQNNLISNVIFSANPETDQLSTFDLKTNHQTFMSLTKKLEVKEEVADFYPKLKKEVADLPEDDRVIRKIPFFQASSNALEENEIIKMGRLVKEFFGKENMGKKIKTEDDKKIENKINELESAMISLKKKQMELKAKEDKVEQMKKVIEEESNKLEEYVAKETKKLESIRDLNVNKVDNPSELTEEVIEQMVLKEELEEKMKKRIKESSSIMTRKAEIYQKIIEKLREKVHMERNDESTMFARFVKEQEERSQVKVQARAQRKKKLVSKQDLPNGDVKKVYEEDCYELIDKEKNKEIVFGDGYKVINSFNGNIEEVSF